VTTREALLADTFLKLADTLVDDFDVIEVLTTLSDRCVELLAAAATGILLADPAGALQVIGASSEAASILELFQIQNEQGPCLDAFHSGRAVVHVDLRIGSPWPRFAAMATEAGFISVHAFPMVVRAKVLGTLNMFLTQPGPLSAADVVVAQALAHAATLALLQYRAAEDSQRLNAQLQGALNSRITVEQAKGAIAEIAGVGTDEAFLRLRSFARNHNAKLTDIANAVVNRTLPSADRAELGRPTSSDKRPGARQQRDYH
jgi:GAF domain-containing protein